MANVSTELRAGCLFTEDSEDAIRDAISVVRAGDSLNPSAWPNGARVAVAITFDVDHEFPVYKLDPAILSLGQYGATTGLPRILALLKKHEVPATFFVPGMVQKIHPTTVPEILSGGLHEVGLHGWVHERAPDLRDREEESRMISRAIEVLTEAAGGVRPVGYRAPNAAISEHTLELLEEHDVCYDSTLSGRDEPHELVLRGRKSALVEIPMSWEGTDYLFLHNDEFWQGSLPWPTAVLDVYKSDFDVAYNEGTIFNLVLHPQVIGRRSRLVILDQLISYIKSRNDVWFATLGQVAEYVSNK
ncbi:MULTISPECIES: polysaccharide deacetylase [Paraburkholderia]|uniref:Polysaccharide deacetylase n=1 Tax=Paraburkholderia dipogonis TaxID=1211383 RepID=A0A4Y8MH00_9BURK|nr:MULTISPECIES: polysaccharide deacetylase [Paraburkholderia]RKR31286.1 polysaccharide deacetylase [Paraburkholderia sp. BL17N1]TFE36740.1 polysaccharide deacetylase [Paraburkholderia dipogonis]